MAYNIFEPDYRDSFDQTKLYEKTIQDLRTQIEHLKGKDREKDAAICDMIREQIMRPGNPEGLEHLTAALLNMKKVMQE